MSQQMYRHYRHARILLEKHHHQNNIFRRQLHNNNAVAALGSNSSKSTCRPILVCGRQRSSLVPAVTLDERSFTTAATSGATTTTKYSNVQNPTSRYPSQGRVDLVRIRWFSSSDPEKEDKKKDKKNKSEEKKEPDTAAAATSSSTDDAEQGQAALEDNTSESTAEDEAPTKNDSEHKKKQDKKEGGEDDDDDPCPPWQNPLHHNNPELQKQFAEDFGPDEEMPIMEAPPLEDPNNPDKILASQELYDLADEIVHLSMLEMKELINKIGDHFGFEKPPFTGSDGSGGGDDDEEADGDGAPVAEAPAKTVFDLKLVSFDPKTKIRVIKEVRAIAGLGLKEAKEMVEGAPKIVMKDIKKEQAEELQKKLEEVGATIEIV